MATNAININTNNTVVAVTGSNYISVITDVNTNEVVINTPITSVVQVNTPGPQGPPGSGTNIINSGSFAVTSSNVFTDNQTIRSGSNASGFSSAIKFENLGYARYTAGISGSTFVIANTDPTSDVWTDPTVIKLQVGDTVSTFNTDLIVTGSISSTNGFIGDIIGTSSWASNAVSSINSISASYADTASYLPDALYQLTSSLALNATTADVASFVNLIPGPGISINGLEITSSVRSVNGIFPTNGNIPTTLTSVITGTSASLILSSSGTITSSITNGTVWIISNNTPDPTKNGNAYIFASGSLGQWYQLSGYDTATYDSRYLKLTPQAALGGALDLGGYNINNVGTLYGTASRAISSSYIYATNNSSSNSTYRVMFTDSTTDNTAYRSLYVDSDAGGLRYVPSSNTLSVYNLSLGNKLSVKGNTSISGSLTVSGSIIGTSSWANSSSYSITASYAMNSGGQQLNIANNVLGNLLIASGSSTDITGTPNLFYYSSSTVSVTDPGTSSYFQLGKYMSLIQNGATYRAYNINNNLVYSSSTPIYPNTFTFGTGLVVPYADYYQSYPVIVIGRNNDPEIINSETGTRGGAVFIVGNGSAPYGPAKNTALAVYDSYLLGPNNCEVELKSTYASSLITNYISSFNGVSINNRIKVPYVGGNIEITGSIVGYGYSTISGFTFFIGTASYATNATNATNAITASYALNGGGGGTPGGSTYSIQYNNGTSFGGDSGLTYDFGNKIFTVNSTIGTGDFKTITSLDYYGGGTYLGGGPLYSNDSGLYDYANNYPIAAYDYLNNTYFYAGGSVTADTNLTSYLPIIANSGITGNLIGTASYVNLTAGPGISVNGTSITASVRSVNGVFSDANGNIAATLAGTLTGTSASLVLSSSGAVTASITNSTLWVVSGDSTPSNNGKVWIYSSGSVGQWLQVAPLDTAAADARYLALTPQSNLAGNLNMGGYNITNIGLLQGTASWAQNSSNAITSSYVVSASYSRTASYAETVLNAPKAGYIAAGAFAGIPLSASVTFNTPIFNNAYAVAVTGEDARTWTIQSKTAAGFTINSNSSTALTGNVYWTATSYNS